MAEADVEVQNPPTDGISAVCYNNTGQYLAAASWSKVCFLPRSSFLIQRKPTWRADHLVKEVRVYAVEASGANCLRTSHSHAGPVLDCCFGGKQEVFSASLDKTLKSFNVAIGTSEVIGEHNEAIRAVCFAGQLGSVVTGSWDRTVKLWDPRAREETARIQLEGKVFSMDVVGHSLIVAEAERVVDILDLRKTAEPADKKESPLRGQTRCVRWFPDGSGYAIGSVDGRLAVEYRHKASASYAFKCHRTSTTNEDGSKTVVAYPVNAIAFNSLYGTFATGGADGKYCIWDGNKKKRLAQSDGFECGISALSFNPAGTQLAIASSYTFENGELEYVYYPYGIRSSAS